MKNFIIAMISFTVISCGSDSEERSNQEINFGNCLVNSTATNLVTDSCAAPTIFNNNICELIEVEENLLLTIQEKDWFPLYCASTGDKLFFHNENGDQINFSITSKSNRISNFPSCGSTSCDEFENGYTCICVPKESASLGMKSESLDLEFMISLSKNIVNFGNVDTTSFTSLLVSSFNSDFNAVTIQTHFSATLNNGNIVESFSDIIQYLGVLTIVDIQFNDVWTFNHPDTIEGLEMYYNKDFGIVGFRDHDGILWALNM